MTSGTASSAGLSGAPGAGAGFSVSSRFDAIICDLDGCLAPEADERIDLGPLVRIAEHNRLSWERRDRPMLTLCTGRPISFVECMARSLCCRLPCMAENGVWVWDPLRSRHERDPQITGEHIEAVRRAMSWVERELMPLGVTVQPGKAASVSLHHDDTELLHSLQPRVERAFREMDLPFRVSATWFYINCDLAFVSKTTAIERFCRATGLRRDRLAGVGDTMSDLKIRDAVGFFACPSNAKEELKPLCGYVASKPMAEGVLEIIERLMQG